MGKHDLTPYRCGHIRLWIAMTDITKIKIDFPNAGAYDEKDPLFIEELKLLVAELSVEGTIRACCVHEIGHLLYFKLLGVTLGFSPDEFQFVFPYVSYGFNRRTLRFEFDHAVAATKTPFNEDTLVYTDETLFGLAKACFAGGVFINEFAKGLSKGDGDDFVRFHRYYVSAIKQRGQMEVLESQLKARAIFAVTDDMQNAKTRESVLLTADQIEHKYLSRMDSTGVL